MRTTQRDVLTGSPVKAPRAAPECCICRPQRDQASPVLVSAVARLVERLGFKLVRVRGSHHMFSHPSIPELVNLQSVNGKCKPYQVKQALDLIDRYNLDLETER